MKKLILLVCLGLFSVTSWAQEQGKVLPFLMYKAQNDKGETILVPCQQAKKQLTAEQYFTAIVDGLLPDGFVFTDKDKFRKYNLIRAADIARELQILPSQEIGLMLNIKQFRDFWDFVHVENTTGKAESWNSLFSDGKRGYDVVSGSRASYSKDGFVEKKLVVENEHGKADLASLCCGNPSAAAIVTTASCAPCQEGKVDTLYIDTGIALEDELLEPSIPVNEEPGVIENNSSDNKENDCNCNNPPSIVTKPTYTTGQPTISTESWKFDEKSVNKAEYNTDKELTPWGKAGIVFASLATGYFAIDGIKTATTDMKFFQWKRPGKVVIIDQVANPVVTVNTGTGSGVIDDVFVGNPSDPSDPGATDDIFTGKREIVPTQPPVLTNNNQSVLFTSNASAPAQNQNVNIESYTYKPSLGFAVGFKTNFGGGNGLKNTVFWAIPTVQ